MASFNKIILIGRMTADPELRYVPSGAPVANFTLAVDRKFSKNDETDFVPVVCWRKLAEIVNEHCHKGKLVSVEGSLQTRTYEDKEGQRRKAFEVNADDVQFLDRGQGGGRSQSSKSPASQGYPPADDNLGIDQIPF